MAGRGSQETSLIEYSVKTASLSFVVTFAQPQIRFVRDWVEVAERLHANLAQFGVGPGAISVESPGSTLTDHTIQCLIPMFRASVRLKVDKIEILFLELYDVGNTKVPGIIGASLSSVTGEPRSLEFSNYAIDMSFHGLIAGVSTTEFVSRFVANRPQGLGPEAGSGTVFYFRPQGERTFISLTVDMSAVVDGGLFVRSYQVWEGRIPHDGIVEKVPSMFIDAFQGLGLRPQQA